MISMHLWSFGWLIFSLPGSDASPPWQKALLEIQTATAAMMEVVETTTGIDTFHGKIWLQQPATFRMDASPYVIIGQQGYIFLKDLRSGKVVKLGQYPADLSWLWNIDSLFTLRQQGQTWIGVPRQPNCGVDSLTYVPSPQGLPSSLTLYFPTQTLSFRFQAWNTNLSLSDTLFQVPRTSDRYTPRKK